MRPAQRYEVLKSSPCVLSELRQIYRHPSCLIKHRWEHTPHWREASKFVLSKHQQVQLLEVSHVPAWSQNKGSDMNRPQLSYRICRHHPQLAHLFPRIVLYGHPSFLGERFRRPPTWTPPSLDLHRASLPLLTPATPYPARCLPAAP